MRRPATPEPARRREHAAWVIDGIRYEFIRIRARDMFAIEEVWIDSRTRVPMFDQERALLDAFVQLRGFGAGGLGDQILSDHWQEIDREKLLRYAETMDRPQVLARIQSALARTAAARPATVV
jgi:predicted transcriptional regulator of viral defense system